MYGKRIENTLHENEAAEILKNVCINEHMHPTDVKEGKIELVADCDGLFRVDVPRLDAINEIDEVMIATRHTNTAVKKGDRLLGTRVIPLVIAKEKMERVKEAAGEKPLVSLTPFKPMKAGIVTTGNEVYYGRIKDTFTPVIIEKLAAYGIEVCGQILCDDNMEHITDAILKLKEEGADLILCTGGMSVDPDDRTPGAIKIPVQESYPTVHRYFLELCSCWPILKTEHPFLACPVVSCMPKPRSSIWFCHALRQA